MASVLVQGQIASSADEVWQLLADFGGIEKWIDSSLIASCESDGSAVGATRTIVLAGGGGSVRERLESLDADARRYSYAIIGESPLPVANYLSVVKVSETGPGQTLVDWCGTFEPRGVPQEEAEAFIRGVYEGGIAGVRKTLQA